MVATSVTTPSSVAPVTRPTSGWPARAAKKALFSLTPLAVIVLGWVVIVEVFKVPPYIVPNIQSVVSALVNGITNGTFLVAAYATLSCVLAGFAVGAVIGLTLAIMMATWETLDRMLYPYIVALQSMPKIAIAPLMIVWFGFGFEAKVAIVALISAFPVLVNAVAGIHSTEHERIELIRALAGGRLQVLWRVQLPSALPYIFAGLQAALVLAVTGAIVGEFVGARQGIGVLILKANFSLDLASVFALLLFLGALAAVLNFALRALSRRIVFWTKAR